MHAWGVLQYSRHVPTTSVKNTTKAMNSRYLDDCNKTSVVNNVQPLLFVLKRTPVLVLVGCLLMLGYHGEHFECIDGGMD